MATRVSDFEQICQLIDSFEWRAEFRVQPMPAPTRIAPDAYACEADIFRPGEASHIGNGRLIVLHDDRFNDAWQGWYRCVSYVEVDVENEMILDPLLNQVAWTWLTDGLSMSGAVFHDESGTVTSQSSTSFGDLATHPDRFEVEIRASWTADLNSPEEITRHLNAWQSFASMTAGLAPQTPGVIPLRPRIDAL